MLAIEFRKIEAHIINSNLVSENLRTDWKSGILLLSQEFSVARRKSLGIAEGHAEVLMVYFVAASNPFKQGLRNIAAGPAYFH
ncbi:hypothetical protein L2E82_28249 [Cichorium intybus]|uniref:Uncharacterized protein n=1 Tax=Cichorium intybus TaxID=13427 RepID=A0ACB9CVF1_CICIN|nr:hypothetical protein L2E82_28249 [Cichorium intybus]